MIKENKSFVTFRNTKQFHSAEIHNSHRDSTENLETVHLVLSKLQLSCYDKILL